MEVMEDGNLMDKVNILIQRDMEYYKSKQTVLQETICPGIIGGRLDFPRTASFAAMKLVLWWEEEYIAAYRKSSGFLKKSIDGSRDSLKASGGCGGIVRSSDPSKFVGLISKSADQLLEHLHILTQEALDHADLTVLTGTIGASALLKNCLWFYVQTMSNVKNSLFEQLQAGYKKYNEMCEALAERLLDLHCRLLSLYILQDADCLDWENSKPFFESERGSYVIQMWWIYMQGTKDDLWSSVPPKMAQRVFAGMLNESLTILTVRYTQSCPSQSRTALLLVDISNLLLCVAQLLPSICDNTEDFIGFSLHDKNKVLRDIHVKCQALLTCLLLRAAPLDILYKSFRKGIENVELIKTKSFGPVPWILFALPNIFKSYEKSDCQKISDLNPNVFISIELMVILSQPQPNWASLLKVLCMRNFKILQLILNFALDTYTAEMKKSFVKINDCGAFLCPSDGSCRNVDTSTVIYNMDHYYDLIQSATDVIILIGNDEELDEILLGAVTKQPSWAKCFERRQVWNQIRPSWYEALVNLTSPIIPTVIQTVTKALQTGATMYQAMSLALACFSQYWDGVGPNLSRVASLFQEALSGDVTPISNSTLMQILISALYSGLLEESENNRRMVVFKKGHKVEENVDILNQSTAKEVKSNILDSTKSLTSAAAESLCSIDEDNKHTDQIEEFIQQVRESKDDLQFFIEGSKRIEQNEQIAEILVSDLLITTHGKKSLKTLYHFIKNNSEWIFHKLGVSETKEDTIPNKVVSTFTPLLHTMFHIGYRPFDQLLTREWVPDWHTLMQIPMGVSMEKVWMQLSLRSDFRDITPENVTSHDIHIVNNLTTLLKQ